MLCTRWERRPRKKDRILSRAIATAALADRIPATQGAFGRTHS